MALADSLNEKTKQAMDQLRFQVGSVFIAEFDESDGVIPQDGDDYRDKRFIILGFDTDGSAIGAVFINKGINVNKGKSEDFILHQYPLDRSNYPTLLTRNSYVNCAQLFCFPINKLKNCNFLGEINECDLELITITVKESTIIKPKIKKQFGLL